jgi:ATP adenylyltransferase
MRYIAGNTKEDGCIFCNRLAGQDDVTSLILHRGQHSFIIMNLFPYNTGHVMIVPNQHAADVSELDAATLHEMADLLPATTRALQRVLNCQGFNIGLNLGDIAGAGVAAHLHQHVVPRWVGDANFMPIIASTMVMPELIPSSYAKIRAELERELTGDHPCMLVVLLNNDQDVLLQAGKLPVIHPQPGSPIWLTAIEAIQPAVAEIEIAGWAGEISAGPASDPVLTLRGKAGTEIDHEFSAARIGDAMATVSPEEKHGVLNSLRALAPSVAAPRSSAKQG